MPYCHTTADSEPSELAYFPDNEDEEEKEKRSK